MARRLLAYVPSPRCASVCVCRTCGSEATTSTLLLGRATDVEVILRAIELGTVKKLHPRGILSPRPTERGQSIRGVPVLGTFGDIERVVQDFQDRQIEIRRLVATPSALAPEAHPEELIARARRLGLPLVRVTSLGEGMRDAELAPLEIEDLLLRDTVEIDRERLAAFIRGKRVLVTGGGGSIGSEICARLVAFGAREVVVLESSEPALHTVVEASPLGKGDTGVSGIIGDIRDRHRLNRAMHGVDHVVHAAALKQVDTAEYNPWEFVQTNIIGSQNVIEACIDSGVQKVVALSTDGSRLAILNGIGDGNFQAPLIYVDPNLNVPQEVVAQALAFGRAFDQAGDVSDGESDIAGLDYAQVGDQGGERVIGDLGLGRAQRRDQRRLARAGEADQRHVGDALELQHDVQLVTGLAEQREPGSLPLGAGQRGVAEPAVAALRDHVTRPRAHHVDQHLTGLGERDDRRRRATSFGVGDDGGLARLQHSDHGIGGAEVDTDGLGHEGILQRQPE